MEIKTASQAPTEPGIYTGVSNADYHAGPGVSKSQLDQLAKSPLHFWSKYVSPNPQPSIETAAMRFGTAVHAAILEPEQFSQWAIMPKVDGRTTAGKAMKAEAEQLAAERGVPIIDAQDHREVMSMVRAAYSNSLIRSCLDNGHAELSVYWIDQDTGMLCRCRPDWLTPSCVLDVKTTENASPASFTRSAYNYRYWVQAAYYLDGLAANGVPLDLFIFAAIEKSQPYAVMAYQAAPQLIEAGRREYKRLLRLLADCTEANNWPGYGDVAFLDLPAFANEKFTMTADDTFASSNESA